MNMVIMCHVHHQSTGAEDKTEILSKSTYRDTSQASLSIEIPDVKDYCII